MGFGIFPSPDKQATYRLADNTDAGTGGYTLTDNDTVTTGLAKFGNGMTLSNTNASEFYSRSDSIGLALSNSFGVSVWFTSNATPASGSWFYLVDLRSSAGTKRGLIITYANQAGVLKLNVYAEGNTYYTYTLTPNKWYKIDCTYTAAGANVDLYLNGIFLFSAPWGASSNTLNLMAIGAQVKSPGSNYWWRGNIDDVAIYNVARTATQIRKQYAHETGKY